MATRYPEIYWNTGCLIVNSHSILDEEQQEDDNEETEIEEEDDDEEINEDSDDEEDDIIVKSKKKTKTVDYDKISIAIGKITSAGVIITPPSINKSTYTFTPDAEHNTIIYGLNGITRIGEDMVNLIISNRPYHSLVDFMTRVNLSKPQMVNLIKSGAFDEFGDRVDIMHEYINAVSDTKKRITMQNMKMLIDFGLIPDDYDLQRRVFNFNKYLKSINKSADKVYKMDDTAFNFYQRYFDIDKLTYNDGYCIAIPIWKTMYDKQMAIVKPWVQAHAAELLDSVNNKLTTDIWNKYCLGSISKWEMDSISCYIHPHELLYVDEGTYEISDFNQLPPTAEIDKTIYVKGKIIPIFKLRRIAGTVLGRDKAKKTISLLTNSGVVTIKIYGVFAEYDRQISERDAEGKKHVIRRSEFTRGNKLIITGIRAEDSFIAKVYKTTPWHRIETIESVNEDGTLVINNRNGEKE